MAFTQLPGTNFHDLNLDWLLKEMKNCLTEWASTKEEWDVLKGSNEAFASFMTSQWNDFRTYVENYLANLPLTEEVSAKINAMVEDGTLLELITHDDGEGSALSDVAGNWLGTHLHSLTEPPVDDTLTIPHAAADAKATGDQISDLKSAVTDLELKMETSLEPGTAIAGNKRFLLNVDNPIANGIHLSRLYMVANSLNTSTDVTIELANKTSTGYTVYDSKSVTLAQTTTIGEIVLVADLDKTTIGNTYIFITTSVTTIFRAASVSGGKLVLSDDTSNASFTVREVNNNYIISFIQYYNMTPESVNSQIKKHFVIVDANGNGDYNSVLTAMNSEPENTVIYIKPGIYNQDMTSCLQKRVILIGADRNQCIIRDIDGRYNHHPLYVSCGYFENLTIESPYVEGESNEIDETTSGSYAVHVDADQDYAIGKQIEFHHCTIRSDFFPAVGIGLRKNMTAILDDCILENNQVSGRGNYSTSGTIGALYFHDSNGEQGNQYIIVKNCILKSKLAYAMCPYQVERNPQENTVYCDFIENVLYSDVGKYANTVWFRNDPFNSSTGIFHIGIGYGNSIGSLNNNS